MGFYDILINRYFYYEALIPREGWERTEIGAAIEEVAVEGIHAKTSRSPNSQDSFEADLSRQVLAEFCGKLPRVFTSRRIPAGVEPRLATGEPG